MTTTLRYVGLDVHKDTIVIALAEEGRQAATLWKTIPYDELRLVKALRLLQKQGAELKVCYEAGPTGYGIQRRLIAEAIDCQVVAPSLIPIQAGNRIKTDQRDAKHLAQFHRAGELTPIYVPDEAVEALARSGACAGRCQTGANRGETSTQQVPLAPRTSLQRRWQLDGASSSMGPKSEV